MPASADSKCVDDLPVSVKFVSFEVEFSFDATAESCVHGTVELLENFECQFVVQQFHLHKLVKSFLESVSQSSVAVQCVRHHHQSLKILNKSDIMSTRHF